MVQQVLGTVLARLMYWLEAVPVLCCPLFWVRTGQDEQSVVAGIMDWEVGVRAGQDPGSLLLLLLQLAGS